jgi:hypothetical protein
VPTAQAAKAVTEEINRRVHRLPEPMQAEVLHFVDFLLTRAERDDARREDRAWSDLSFQSAMHGMEDEDGPEYSEADLTEPFS